MSRPIMMTDDLIKKMAMEFIESIRKVKMSDGKISYTKSFAWDSDDKVNLNFTPEAFAKMTMLIQHYSSEVAWHGVAYRDVQCDSNFNITDILVYPQLVDGSNVNTDQAEYTNWLYSLEDDVFNNLRMQGHSHVNFSTTPSAVDLTHQAGLLEQCDGDMFYIFMIWNKKFEHTIKIFDMKNNTLYEDKDINVTIGESGVDLDGFIKSSEKVVKKKPVKTYTTPTYQGGYRGYGSYGGQTTQQNKKSKVQSVGGSYHQASGYDYDDDYGYPYSGSYK